MHTDLENKLLRTVGYWCHRVTKEIPPAIIWDPEQGETAEVQNAFYPQKSDLEPIVWIKLLAPEVTSQVERMWEKGPFDVDKFVSRIVTNTLIDFNRHHDVRESEILAISLDHQVYATKSSDAITEKTGDTISDFIWDIPRYDMPWCGPSMLWAFQPEAIAKVTSLKSLSPEERHIWQQVTFDGLGFNSKNPEENVKAVYSRGRCIGKPVSKTQAALLYRRAQAI